MMNIVEIYIADIINKRMIQVPREYWRGYELQDK